MAFKIYTKTGDAGTTGLYGGARLSKDDIRIESYGTVDELNSFIGLLSDSLNEFKIPHILFEVQNRLFTIGSNLASDPDKELSTPDLKDEDILLLEKEIDQMDQILEPLKHFILPGGHQSISHCHIARTVCRRAERRVVSLANNQDVNPIIIKYLNRLSDYFFVLSRFVGHKLDVKPNKWEPRND